MIKETGIDELYEKFRRGKLEFVRTLDFLPNDDIIKLKVFTKDKVIRLFIFENNDVKQSKILKKVR